MPWGVAAAAVAAAGTVGSAEINKGNTSSSTHAESPATQQADNLALQQGESIAQRAYTPYTGQVVAPETANQQQGTAQAASGYAPAQSALSSAASGLEGVQNNKYSQSALQPYMDPYVSSVLNPVLTQENVNYQQNKAALLDSKAGAFGGDRSALEEGQLEYAHGQNVAQDTANAYSQAFTNAQQAFFTDQQRQTQAATALANVGNDMSQLNTTQIQNLMSTGSIGQVLNQAQLNFNYQQFLENRDWSTTNLQPLLNAIDASKGVAQTGTQTSAPGSALGTIIGGATAVAGAYFTGLQNQGSNYSGPSEAEQQSMLQDETNTINQSFDNSQNDFTSQLDQETQQNLSNLNYSEEPVQ